MPGVCVRQTQDGSESRPYLGGRDDRRYLALSFHLSTLSSLRSRPYLLQSSRSLAFFAVTR